MIRGVLIFGLLNCILIFPQNSGKASITGTVSFKSSRNIYIKFTSTQGISVGDTLYVKKEDTYLPVAEVEYLSSASAACRQIGNMETAIGDPIWAFTVIPEKTELTEETALLAIPADDSRLNSVIIPDKNIEAFKFDGRVSVSAYSNFTNLGRSYNFQRWRYLISGNAQKIGGNQLDLETYITFSYRANQWEEVKDNLGSSIRIYSLAADFSASRNLSFIFGRKINRDISNLGAIDGLQAAYRFNLFKGGIIIGSRPDFGNYGYNLKLFQYGIYLSRSDSLATGIMQNSIGLFEQTNNFSTDRRFLYLQHSSPITPDFNVFASSEVDLFKIKNGTKETTFSLTSLYFLLRYRISRGVSISASYDARKNVVYYETFKNYADSLLESETRQGFRVRINLRPVTNLFLTGMFGYRYRPGDIRSTRNYAASVGYTNLPIIGASFSLSATVLNTNYLDGLIYGIRINKDLVHGLLNTGIGFRRVDYTFLHNRTNLIQDILSLDMSFRILRDLMLSITYEGTYEKTSTFNRIFANLTKRF